MESFSYVIKDPLGIHARPAGMLVKKAGEFSSELFIEKSGKKADMKRLISVMSLCVKSGDTVTVTANGVDEKKACDGLKSYFENNL